MKKTKKLRALFCAALAIILSFGTAQAQDAAQAQAAAQTAQNAGASPSAQPLSLTIQDAVDLALKNNVQIKQSKIQLDAAKRSKNTSWNSASPSLTASGGLSKSNRDFPENYSAYVQGSVNVTLSTNLYTDIKNAALKYQAGQISYETACRSVELKVRNAFYNLLYQADNINLQKTNAETARQTYETNRRKYGQGAISQLDVLSSQVNYETQLPALQSAQISYDNDLAAFKQTLGIEQDAQIELVGSLDAFSDLQGVSVEGIETRSLELLALEKNLEIARNSLLANRFSAYGPTLSAGWTYRPTWTNGSSEPVDNGGLSLSVTLPLDGFLPWSKKADNISAAKDTIANYELQIADKKTSLSVSAQSGVKKIEQSISAIQTLKSSVSLAEQSYRMTQEAYNRGSRNWTELLNARTSLEKARLNLKQQAYNLASSILNLENTLGVPFGTLSGAQPAPTQGDSGN